MLRRTIRTAAIVLAVCAAMLLGRPVATAGGASSFYECGTILILEGEGGTLWNGYETHNGQMYILDTTLGFGDGADVCITGTVSACEVPPGFPVELDGCVAVSGIAADMTGGPIQLGVTQYTTLCGTVDVVDGVAGSTCVIFSSEYGTVYRLTGTIPDEVLGSDDPVSVVGSFVEADCQTPCGTADGCITDPVFSACPVLGDLNLDSVVDGLDLGVLLAQWGQAGTAADLNADGTVNGLDLGILLANWG